MLDDFDLSKLPGLISSLSMRSNVQMRLYTLKVYSSGVEDAIALFEKLGVDKKIVDKVIAELKRKNIEEIYNKPIKKKNKLDVEFET